jgi:hypothetical protein
MKKIIGFGFVAFLVTLAIVIGQRMSTDAMAVVIGVVFGVAASIPTSLLVMAATRRSHAAERPTNDHWMAERYAPPPVIVLNSGGLPQAGWQQAANALAPPSSAPTRRFRIVGGDGTSDWLEDEPAENSGWRLR